MLLSEREHLVDQAIANMAMLAPALASASAYRDQLRAKLLVLLQAIDAAVRAAETPVLFTEIVPGYDMLAIKPFGDVVVGTPEVEAAIDIRGAVSLDESTLQVLSMVFDQVFNQKVVDPTEECAVYRGQDQVHYVAYPSHRRDDALASIGVSAPAL